LVVDKKIKNLSIAFNKSRQFILALIYFLKVVWMFSYVQKQVSLFVCSYVQSVLAATSTGRIFLDKKFKFFQTVTLHFFID